MKIQKIESLVKYLKKKKISKKKIVLCHGVFDILHLGHVRYLKFAKKFNNNKNFLIVSVTADKFIDKGLGRPYFNEKIRMEMLSNLVFVDAVILSNNFSAENIIKQIKPGYYFKGQDYKDNSLDKSGRIYREKNEVMKYGGKIIYTNQITFSSSNILNSNNLIFNEKQKKTIDSIKKRFSYQWILKLINDFKKLNITILGEIIFDEYCFGDVIGKSGKEPHLVLKEKQTECYLGGSAAVAKHLSSFVKKINLISFLGNEKNYIKMLKNNLSKKVILHSFKPHKDFKSIVKKRFIDQSSNYKLFGSYVIPDKNTKYSDNIISAKLKNLKKSTDILIITDYGHGFISKKISNKIIKKFKFTSLNAQLNAANIGTHTIRNYKNIDLIIINEAELRNEERDDITEIKYLAKKFFNNRKCKNLVITRGKEGAILIDKQSIIECPAFAKKSIDKLGAGDAMLSIISLCLKNNLDKELSLFLGSVAGAYSVETIGNKSPVSFAKIDKFLDYAFK